MIKEGKIRAEQVLAISVDENPQVVLEAVKKRNYTFPVVWDKGGLFSKEYNVSGTPTIIVINKDKQIVWATSGISPLLEVRLKSYLQ